LNYGKHNRTVQLIESGKSGGGIGVRSGVLNVGIDIIPNPFKGLTACLLATGSNPVRTANKVETTLPQFLVLCTERIYKGGEIG